MAFLRLNSGPTVGDILAKNRGAGPGFDLIRVGLSLSLVLWHTTRICFGDDLFMWQFWPLRPLLVAIVPVFFALSGFLVTGSAIRTKSVRVFLTFRILRIAPALVVEVALSALILGPLVTQFSLQDYFADPKFVRYFGSIIGWVQYQLPGVFITNPLDTVNANLWTLRPEFFCYVVMAGLMISGLVFHRTLYTLLFAVSHLGFIAFFLDPDLHFGATERNVTPFILCYCFVLGSVLYHWSHRIRLNPALLGLALIGAYAGLSFDVTLIPGCICATYCMIYAGMCRMPHIPLLKRGDYSYGIYLYGFPMTQTIYYFCPVLREWWLLFLVAAPATTAFAMVSWHVVEKPTLALKRLFLAKQAAKPAAGPRGVAHALPASAETVPPAS